MCPMKSSITPYAAYLLARIAWDYKHIWQKEHDRPPMSFFTHPCHSERERRISRVGHRDSSLTLRMTSN